MNVSDKFLSSSIKKSVKPKALILLKVHSMSLFFITYTRNYLTYTWHTNGTKSPRNPYTIISESLEIDKVDDDHKY